MILRKGSPEDKKGKHLVPHLQVGGNKAMETIFFLKLECATNICLFSSAFSHKTNPTCFLGIGAVQNLKIPLCQLDT